MKGKDHLLLGTGAGILTAASIANNTPEAVAFATACAIGSIYPDIDLDNSMFGSKVPHLAGVINRTFGHRGFIHTPINAFLMSAVIFFISRAVVPDYALMITAGFFMGFFIHLIQDTVTHRGIKWLYPLKIDFHLTNLSSDSFVCTIITLLLLALIWILYKKIPNLPNNYLSLIMKLTSLLP